MINHINGNAVDYVLNKEKSVLLHVVTCQKTMASGIALEVKNKIPDAYDKYVISVQELGNVSFCYDTSGYQKVCNLSAQKHYGRDKRHLNYGALGETFSLASKKIYGDVEIVIPYLMGCDRAGGNWEIVLEMIDFYFKCFNVTIVNYNGEK